MFCWPRCSEHKLLLQTQRSGAREKASEGVLLSALL